MDIEDAHIGRRIREIRVWRDMDQTIVAHHAGISQPYLSLIEAGHRPVTKRSLLESIARVLRVSPKELTSNKPWEGQPDPEGAKTHDGLIGIAAALDFFELGEDPGEFAREWPEVATDIKQSVDFTQLHGDDAILRKQCELLPKLLSELHALYVRNPEQRQNVLLGLILCYRAVVSVTKLLVDGNNGFTLMAAKMAQRCADELESPQWRGVVTWLRGHAVGSLNRPQQYQRAVRMADELSVALDDPEVVQAYGQLHLSAALAAAAQSDQDLAMTHLDEADAVARRLDTEVGTFANMWFGKTNVGIWRVSIGLELGDGASVAEVARDVHVETIPSPARQAAFFADVGRALVGEKSTREKGLNLFLRAESLAPQHVRNNVFVREIVGDLYRAARRDAGGRELRGLAFRMGIAPTG